MNRQWEDDAERKGRILVVDALSFYSLLYGPPATADAAKPFAEQARTQILSTPDGQFAADADPDQFAQDLHGVLLAYHHVSRLLRDPAAEQREPEAPRVEAQRPPPRGMAVEDDVLSGMQLERHARSLPRGPGGTPAR